MLRTLGCLAAVIIALGLLAAFGVLKLIF